MSLEVGTIVEGVVTGITRFGAFVTLPGGITGLVHISEVADDYVHDVKDYLKERDKIKVKIISIKDGKIGLSIRKVRAERKQMPPPPPRPIRTKIDRLSFEDKLLRFMKESDERQTDLRRSTDAKRGGRGARRNSSE